MILIMDGRVQDNNLQSAQLDKKLAARAARRGAAWPPRAGRHSVRAGRAGRLSMQDRQGNLRQFQAIAPGEVKW